MTGQDSEISIVDPSNEAEVTDVGAMKEEMRKLKAQMAEMHRAWSQGHPAPLYPANPSYIPPLTQAQEPTTPHASSAFPYQAQGYGTTSYAPPAPPSKQNLPPPMVPVFVAPPPAPLHRSSSETLFQTHDTQYYPPEPTFKVPEPYTYSPHFEIPGEVEKPVKNAE
ncbi:extensin-like [Nicotiana sylvestris]|uniref:extensin-like n=1 Tax=Nicotiana sylvestris TaxID=4096 RepID=UPI00388CC8B6